ncbi:type IV secretion system protein [Bartonella phoceensis]|uniref:type IV secretion system protein n=1 Tax=Bartonella phoceensis TaxID=270249 RepID=UPI001ABA1DC3|nr:type IV secretion system protein [Bartonella phoceensis]
MKRVIVAIIFVVTSGCPNLAMAMWWGAGLGDPTVVWGNPSKSPPQDPPQDPPENPPENPPKPASNTIVVPKPLVNILQLLKKQIEQSEKIHQSIAGNKKSDREQMPYSSFFLKEPKTIYDKTKRAKMSVPLREMQYKEALFGSARDMRKSIEQRILYTMAINRHVSEEAFENTDARLNYVLFLLNKLDGMKDLKSLTDLQIRVNSMMALIDNEGTKFQMVAHLRDTEKELIKQQKRKRNLKILSSENKTMPIIRSIR